jgi:hypothetical protein
MTTALLEYGLKSKFEEMKSKVEPPPQVKMDDAAPQGQAGNYTRNEWRRCETTLETSEEDVKLHSKRVKRM